MENRNWDRVVYSLFPRNDLTVSGMYGSVISRDAPGGWLHYVNRLATPGRLLMQWQSCPVKGNPCIQPELPPPPRGQEVRVYSFWRSSIPRSYSLAADYLDKRGTVIAQQRLDTGGDFDGKGNADWEVERRTGLLQIPQEACHWRLRFVQSGEGELWFHHIALVLLQDEEAWNRDTVYHPMTEEKRCRILIPEISGRTCRLPDPDRAAIRDLSGGSGRPEDVHKFPFVSNLRTMPLLLAASAAVIDSAPRDAEQKENECCKHTKERIREFLENAAGESDAVELLACGPTSLRTAQLIREISKTAGSGMTGRAV